MSNENCLPENRERVRVFLSIKYYEDNRNRVFIEEFSYVLRQRSIDLVCIVRDVEAWGSVSFNPKELMAATFALIRSCEYLVVDLSEKGIGLGIEVGYAAAQQIPILAIAPKNTEFSTTILGVAYSCIEYVDCLDAARQVFENIVKNIG